MNHLIPDNFVQACKKLGVPLDYRFHDGYEHGYLFVGTFIGEHIKLHSDILRQWDQLSFNYAQWTFVLMTE